MTPLEHKQIQIEAVRDVLFEQQGPKSSGAEVDEGDETSTPGTRLKPRGKKKQKIERTEAEDSEVRIEGLSYRVCPRVISST